MKIKTTLILAAIFLAVAVALGAFGAHGLEGKISSSQLDTYETANRYHFYHSFGMLLIGILMTVKPTRELKFVSMLLVAGIVFFSGSLYLLATNTLLGIEQWKWLGPITPVGGLCFILAWLLLSWSFVRTFK